MNCQRCALSRTRLSMVEPRGVSSAKFLFIGEAPGTSEDVLGKAFVGESGKLLDKMALRAGMELSECYFITTVLCRSCDRKNGPGREPTPDEILACLPVVKEYIDDVELQGVVLVGAIATKYYKSKFPGIPIVSITEPRIIRIKGGTASPLFIDNVNKLERFYDQVVE